MASLALFLTMVSIVHHCLPKQTTFHYKNVLSLCNHFHYIISMQKRSLCQFRRALTKSYYYNSLWSLHTRLPLQTLIHIIIMFIISNLFYYMTPIPILLFKGPYLTILSSNNIALFVQCTSLYSDVLLKKILNFSFSLVLHLLYQFILFFIFCYQFIPWTV